VERHGYGQLGVVGVKQRDVTAFLPVNHKPAFFQGADQLPGIQDRQLGAHLDGYG
jgi:hypothetical protein